MFHINVAQCVGLPLRCGLLALGFLVSACSGSPARRELPLKPADTPLTRFLRVEPAAILEAGTAALRDFGFVVLDPGTTTTRVYSEPLVLQHTWRGAPLASRIVCGVGTAAASDPRRLSEVSNAIPVDIRVGYEIERRAESTAISIVYSAQGRRSRGEPLTSPTMSCALTGQFVAELFAAVDTKLAETGGRKPIETLASIGTEPMVTLAISAMPEERAEDAGRIGGYPAPSGPDSGQDGGVHGQSGAHPGRSDAGSQPARADAGPSGAYPQPSGGDPGPTRDEAGPSGVGSGQHGGILGPGGTDLGPRGGGPGPIGDLVGQSGGDARPSGVGSGQHGGVLGPGGTDPGPRAGGPEPIGDPVGQSGGDSGRTLGGSGGSDSSPSADSGRGSSSAEDHPTSTGDQVVPRPAPAPRFTLHTSVATVLDTNLYRSESEELAQGTISSAAIRFRSSPSRPALQLYYEAAHHAYRPADDWDRVSQLAQATFARRLTPVLAVELQGEAAIKGTSEDRDLGNLYSLAPRLEYRFGSDYRLRLTGVYRLRELAEPAATTETARYAQAELRQRLDARTWTLRYRYEANQSPAPRRRYSRWTFGTDHTAQLGTRDVLGLEIRYRAQTYHERILEIRERDVPRQDHRWIGGLTWTHTFPFGFSTAFEYAFETRSSNDPGRHYDAHTTSLTLSKDW
jgi:hypothetical protein